MAVAHPFRFAALAAGLFALAAAGAVSATGPATKAAAAPLRIGLATPQAPETQGGRIYLEEGFEGDLASALAGRLKTKAQIVRLGPDEADAALRDGRIDLLVARAGPAAAPNVEAFPVGYASGQSAALRSDTDIRDWSDLRGRTACVSKANLAGRRLAEAHGATLRLASAPAAALIDLRTGLCDASIHDAALLKPLLEKRIWRKFSATLPETAPTTLAVVASTRQPDVVEWAAEATAAIAGAAGWKQRAASWASTVDFEVYRDQVAADCH
ncbi:hypothetical protein GCM10008171_35030 [Methylopila jiangsuensis]|uniref:Solute-binding protein family 3/N-terminal domain-containing protein n=1 Tax=Methylopila jiangsuensis TaxID=586230 RepID=A0A9W6N4K9_9HYPH|nr:transporter substrate-binding domain-containing protein [Methylopila jiangsuensis]MDR6284366.1 polar amino acid transport system substrate-binding protein [Methylopila jiangsuensis]GLK78249.1 hypothetical protein GCM10008171_35030 [Methylopila jiangsuensis]